MKNSCKYNEEITSHFKAHSQQTELPALFRMNRMRKFEMGSMKSCNQCCLTTIKTSLRRKSRFFLFVIFGFFSVFTVFEEVRSGLSSGNGFSPSSAFSETPSLFSGLWGMSKGCGTIGYFRIASISPVIGHPFLIDKDSRLEKRVDRAHGEGAANHFDGTGFRKIIPGGLLPSASTNIATKGSSHDWATVRVSVKGQEIRFQSVLAHRTRIDFLSVIGKHVAAIERECGEGEFTVDIGDHFIGAGAYIIKFSYPGMAGRSMYFPAFINSHGKTGKTNQAALLRNP
jgi:hypothetical protein